MHLRFLWYECNFLEIFLIGDLKILIKFLAITYDFYIHKDWCETAFNIEFGDLMCFSGNHWRAVALKSSLQDWQDCRPEIQVSELAWTVLCMSKINLF